MTGVTPEFVPPEGFAATQGAILAQTTFGTDLPSATITLYGAPGAGKDASRSSASKIFLLQAAWFCTPQVRTTPSNWRIYW